MNEANEAELETPEEQSESRLGVGVSYVGMALGVLLLILAAALGFWLGVRQGGGPGSDSAEAGFARDMITHHAQAVEMALLVRERSQDEELRQVALDIVLTQQAQIGQMQGWLNTWRYPLANAGPAMAWMDAGHSSGMAHSDPVSGLMPGMATPEQMNALRGLAGVEADVLFLQLMITHHVSGVEMAQAALERAQRSEVKTLAQAMVNAQTYEIEVMQAMLAAKGAQPVEIPQGMDAGHSMPMP